MSYCSVADLRAEGLTIEQASKDEAEKLISEACDFIDKYTGQWFELREKTIRLDGRGGQFLVLPVFLRSVISIKVNNETLDPNEYVLYNRISPEDDRRYPKIFCGNKWSSGILNIKIRGYWGYVEEDLTTPLLIRRAAIKLVLYKFLPTLGDADAQAEKNTQRLLVKETTDGHSYELAENAVEASSSSSLLSTGDVEVDEILEYFKRPHFRMAIV